MSKLISLILLIGFVFLSAFVPIPFGDLPLAQTTSPTPTTASTAEYQQGFEFWCFPQSVAYPKDPAAVVRNDKAVDVVENEEGLILNGPFSACYIQLPGETGYEKAKAAIFDLSNGSAWLTRSLVENESGWIVALTHSYLVNPPLWFTHYRLEIQAADGTVLYSSPLLYQREWRADPCWNGNLPNPTTLRCPLQQDLHPWDAGYGEPLPTVKPAS